MFLYIYICYILLTSLVPTPPPLVLSPILLVIGLALMARHKESLKLYRTVQYIPESVFAPNRNNNLVVFIVMIYAEINLNRILTKNPQKYFT